MRFLESESSQIDGSLFFIAMPHITLVFTVHKENGKCNSMELLDIIKNINPEVIFEELSDAVYYQCYIAQTRKTLETTAIERYLTIKNVKHIPVDTYEIPLNEHDNFNIMFEKLTRNMDFQYFLKKQIETEYINGFPFLNGKQNDMVQSIIKNYQEKFIHCSDDSNLRKIYDMWVDYNDKKETVIIENIYNYSNSNAFTKGILFIGSGHRKSIIRKINATKKTKMLKLDWGFYDFGVRNMQANGT